MMRKGSASTVRALAEQSSAIEQVARETDKLIARFTGLAKAMPEQAKNSQEITAAASDLTQQAAQASRGMEDQTRTFKGIAANTANITKQIQLVAAANLENSRSTTVIVQRIDEIREVSRTNGAEAETLQLKLLPKRDRPASNPRLSRQRSDSPPAKTRAHS